MRTALGRMLGVIATGVLLALSFPPFDFDWAAWVALVPLLLAIGPSTGVLRAFLLGLGGTLPFFVGVAYGLWPFDAGLAVLFPAVLGVVAAGVFGAHAMLVRRIASPALRALVLPSLWILAEYGTTAVGIPWALAISQTRRLVLVQAAAVLGMSWVSFVIVAVNVAVHEGITSSCGVSGRTWSPAALLIALTALAGDLTYGAWCLTRREPADATVRVASIQPMLSSDFYTYQWLNADYRHTIETVIDELSEKAAAMHPDLLVWPENGNGQVNFRVPVLQERIGALARRSGATLLVSSYDADERGRRYNAVFSVAPDGSVLGRYAKVRLAPGGEEGFSPGTDVAPLRTPHGPVGALVCLESCLPWIARSLTAQGAVLLMVTTSDVSMRASAPPLNHARFAVYRAIENRRAVVQASNGGPSQLIDPWGAVTQETGFLARATLLGDVPLMRVPTWYTTLGDWPLLGVVLAVLVVAALAPAGVRPPVSTRVGWVPVAAVPTGIGAGLVMALASLGTIAAARGQPSWREAATALLERSVVTWPRDAAAEFRDGAWQAGGVAALAYTLHVLGVTTRPADLLPKAPDGLDGSDPAALVAMADAVGFRAWGAHGDMAALRRLPKPVMARTHDGRWLVILSAHGDRIELFDPLAGYVRTATPEFQTVWRGDMLIVRYASPPAGATHADTRSKSRTEGGDAGATL